jgi:hypothetical protein
MLAAFSAQAGARTGYCGKPRRSGRPAEHSLFLWIAACRDESGQAGKSPSPAAGATGGNAVLFTAAPEALANPDLCVPLIVCLLQPPSVADDRLVATEGAQGSRSPRCGLVFCFWQCDKKNHGWREGPPVTVSCQVSICWSGLHPPASQFRTKREYCFAVLEASPSLRTLAGLKRLYDQVDSSTR